MKLDVTEYKRMCIDERMTDKEILRHLHYSEKSAPALRKWKKKHNIPLGRSRIKLATREDLQHDANTMTISQIADKYIVSESTVRVYLKEHNISYQKKGRFGWRKSHVL